MATSLPICLFYDVSFRFLASLVVELGEFDISGATEFMPTRQAKVKRVVVHKDYQAPTFENDIAILELVSLNIAL